MIIKEAVNLGFELVKIYTHDQYKTLRYKKGILQVEFTYENGKLVTYDLTIEEVNCKEVSYMELYLLDAILNRDSEINLNN